MRARILLMIVMALALIAVSCADDGEVVDSASPTAPAGEESVGQEAATTVEATTPGTAAPADQPVGLYSTMVKPTLQASCVSCHSEGGPGSAHFDLNTATDAKNIAAQLALVTGVGYMPPWPSSELSVAFHGDRTISQEQIDAIAEWAGNGAELDVPADDPLVATVQVLPQIEQDYVLTAEPYKGSLDRVDDYRCQIYDPELTETKYLQNYDLVPDVTQVVHHALVFRADAELLGQAQELDAADPGPGWNCFGLSGLSSDTASADQIMGWAPGQQATVFPADTGIQMDPGDFIVMQLHYHYEPEFESLPADESAIVLDFASDEIIEAAGGEITPLDLSLYLGPAEIPCTENESGPLCDREAALEIVAEEAGGFAGVVANLFLRQCGQTPEDYADQTSGIVSSTCDLNARPGQIVSVFVHEHEIGSKIRMTINPDTPEERILIDVPDWDFDWQLSYYPVEDIILEEGDTIRIDCEWDRSKIPVDAEPRYIVWADGTADEMCYTQIFTRPVG